MRVVCYGCAADVDARERIGRRDTCAVCGVDLHSCRQCRFYDPRVYNECRESQAERVLDKVRANFCDYFAPTDATIATAAAPVRETGTPRAPAAQGAVPRTGADPRAELDRLFRRH